MINMDFLTKQIDLTHKKNISVPQRTVAEEIFGMDRHFSRRIGRVVDALQQAGYEPYAPLISYVNTGDDTYITRRGGAREIARTIDPGILREYLRCMDMNRS